MPRNEDGEFELILGNKQLLSVFFIVVTLLAVFFAMGFIMGRSVNPVAEARKVDNSPSDKPIIVDVKPSAGSGMASAARPVEIKSPIEAEVKTAPEVKLPEPKLEVKSKAEIAKEAEAKKAEDRKAEREKADREKEAKKAEKEAKAEAKKAEKKTEAKREPVSSGAGKPGAGTYLQVAAVGKSEADLVSEVLGKKGFNSFVLPVDGKPDLYRVVVGPVKAGGDQSKTMDELKGAGFKPFPRKL